jgi:Zn-dependent protease with chaperone function
VARATEGVAPQAGGFHQSAKRTAVELGLLLAALGLLFLGLKLGAGWVADAAVAGLPASVDASVGKAGAESFRARYAAAGEPSAAERERVGRVFDELRAKLSPDESKRLAEPRVTLVADPTVNAFALPGGEVFVLSGLLARVGDDDDLLRGVLAHELGHAVLRHGIRSLARNAAFGIALAFVLGDADGVVQLLVGGAAQLEQLGYGRAMETEADDFGVELMRRAGRDPEGLARFLDTLEQAPVPELLSTHPDPGARAKAIRAKLR